MPSLSCGRLSLLLGSFKHPHAGRVCCAVLAVQLEGATSTVGRARDSEFQACDQPHSTECCAVVARRAEEPIQVCSSSILLTGCYSPHAWHLGGCSPLSFGDCKQAAAAVSLQRGRPGLELFREPAPHSLCGGSCCCRQAEEASSSSSPFRLFQATALGPLAAQS